MLRQKGYSLITWVLTLVLVVAGLFFIQSPLKRALQAKAMRSADYFFWRSWAEPTQDYKGDESTYLKSQANQQQDTYLLEQKNKEVGSVRKLTPPISKVGIRSSKQERSASTGVAEGSEALLKLFDLNQVE